MTVNSLMRKLFTGAVTASLIKISSIGLSFVFLLVLSRSMNAYQFGIFASSFSAVLILGSCATFGQHTAVLRFWPSIEAVYGKKVALHTLRRGLALIGLGMGAVISIGCILSFIGVRLPIFGSDSRMWIIIGLFSAIFSLSEFSLSVLRAQGRVCWALMPKDILWRPIVILVIFGFGLPWSSFYILCVMTAILMLLSLSQLILLCFSDKQLLLGKIRKKLPNKEYLGMRHAQWGFWGSAIVGPLQQQASTIIIGIVLGPAQAGAFFAANRLAGLLQVVLIGSNQIASPMIAKAWKKKQFKELEFIATLIAVVSFAISFLGFLIFLLAGEFVLSLFDKSYQDAYWALIILAVGQLVNTACGPNGMMLLMAEKERVFLSIQFFSGALNLCLVPIGAALLGLIGAALAVAFGMVLWNLLTLIAVHSYLNVGYRLLSLRSDRLSK